MSVFGQQSHTDTEMGTQLGQSDYSLATNYHGSAPLNGTITEPTWLSPTNGVDCKLIHGDRWQEILGNMTQHIQSTDTSTYDGTVTATYNSDVTRDMLGTVTENYYDSESRTHCATVEESYLDVVSQEDPAPKFEHHAWVSEAVGAEFHAVGAKSEFLGAGATFAGTEFKGVGLAVDVCVFDMGIKGQALDMNISHDGFHFDKEDLSILKSELHAIGLAFRSLKAKIEALAVSAGAALGLNQIM